MALANISYFAFGFCSKYRPTANGNENRWSVIRFWYTVLVL